MEERSLVTVAGSALSRRINQVLGALIPSLETTSNDDLASAINETLRELVGSISDAEGLNTLMLLLLDWYEQWHQAWLRY